MSRRRKILNFAHNAKVASPPPSHHENSSDDTLHCMNYIAPPYSMPHFKVDALEYFSQKQWQHEEGIDNWRFLSPLSCCTV